MSSKRTQRYCRKCKRSTQHEITRQGRTCELCKTFTSKEADAITLYDVSSRIKS